MNISVIDEIINNEKDSKTRCVYRMVKERLLENPTTSAHMVMEDMIKERMDNKKTYMNLNRSDLAYIEIQESEIISKLMERF